MTVMTVGSHAARTMGIDPQGSTSGGAPVGDQNQGDWNKDRSSQGSQTGQTGTGSSGGMGQTGQTGSMGQTGQTGRDDWKKDDWKKKGQDDQSDVTSTESDQDPLLDRR
jgi:hypothetical protein